jgi:hypothetical protein
LVMPDRSLGEPTEYVIWGASGLLALLLGLGAAFVLWAGLHRSAEVALVDAAVAILGAGLLLLGLATERPLVRLFIILFAVMMAAGFAVGGPEFARLLP